MSNCLFCKIVNGEINSEIVYEDAHTVAFKDISPSAPIHYLIVPREHIETVNEATAENAETFGRLFAVAATLAKAEGVAERGYRLIANCNADGGQEIFHVHLHLLAGQPMGRMVSTR